MVLNRRQVIVALAGTLLSACFTFLIIGVSFLYTSVISDDQGFKYTVPQGASFQSVVHDLHSLNIIKHPSFFNLLARLKGNEHELKAGEYLFPKDSTPASILRQITTGSGMFHYTFTIIAGWNFSHLRQMLESEPNLQHVSSSLTDAAIMAYLGHPELSPEGRFYPDSYYYLKGSSDLALLKRAFLRMQSKLDEVWKTRESGLPYQTQQEALTVASLVEKETALDKERPMIAGVIVNRLRKNMLLQIDPTVIYAAGMSYDGKIHKSDLLLDSPYNTYKHKGLPPTPIAIPGMVSILSALHPQHHDFYYFVAKSHQREDGHQFSTTLAEHHEAVIDVRGNQAKLEYFNDDLIRYYFSRVMLTKIYRN